MKIRDFDKTIAKMEKEEKLRKGGDFDVSINSREKLHLRGYEIRIPALNLFIHSGQMLAFDKTTQEYSSVWDLMALFYKEGEHDNDDLLYYEKGELTDILLHYLRRIGKDMKREDLEELEFEIA